MKNKAKILFINCRMTPPFFLGGAEVSQRILATSLFRAGYSVECVGSYAHPVRKTYERFGQYCSYIRKLDNRGCFRLGKNLSYCWRGIRCTMASAEGILDAAQKAVDAGADLVITQLEGAAGFVEIAKARRIPSVVWVHDVLEVGLTSLESGATHILYTSNFVREKAMAISARDGHVFYPPFSPAPRRIGQHCTRGWIMLVNPIPEKGWNLLLELTGLLPELTFVAVEAWRHVKVPLAYRRKNLRYMRRRINMWPLYEQTRLLLAPSLWDEAFGRVVVEAGLAGCPSIVSNRGGLVEAVGDGGWVAHSDGALDWAEIIKAASDAPLYKDKAQRAIRHAREFLRNPVDELVAKGILPSL